MWRILFQAATHILTQILGLLLVEIVISTNNKPNIWVKPMKRTTDPIWGVRDRRSSIKYNTVYSW